MACFHPLEAVRRSGAVCVLGAAVERRLQWLEGRETFLIPCGKCIGCRSVRARMWAIRCVHEASLYDANAFVTLTYNEANYEPGLNYGDFQLFMRYLRRRLGPTRFFMCGEYGDLTYRPHFHVLLFGRTFTDGVPCGQDIYSSGTLSKLWPHGFSSFGEVTFQSAGYVARYCVQRVSGDIADIWYTRVNYQTGEIVKVVPEFGQMSLKPGIGYVWFQRFWKDVYKARDGVVMNGGNVVPPPRYYDRLLLKMDSDLREAKDFDRYIRSQKFVEDCSPARLLVREKCMLAREKFRRRGL